MHLVRACVSMYVYFCLQPVSYTTGPIIKGVQHPVKTFDCMLKDLDCSVLY